MRYFLSRYNRGYAFLIQCDLRVLYGATIAFQSMIAVVWFFFWYMPMRTQIERVHAQIGVSDPCAAYAQCKKRIVGIKQEVGQLRARVAKKDNEQVISDETIMPLFCTTMHSVGAKIIQCSIADVIQEGCYVRYRIDVQLQASLSQLIRFFDLCYQKQYVVQCEQLFFAQERKSVVAEVRMVLDWYGMSIKKSPSTLEKS